MSRMWDIPVHDSTRVRDVRVAAEAACARAGHTPGRTAIAALVATELTTNLLKHAGGGRMVINLVDRTHAGPDIPGPSVQLVSADHGPGIADFSAALRDGYTTSAGSLGAGLGTCLRIADDFDLHSTPGARAQAEHSGDDWGWVRSGPRLTLMLADGLGHGPQAARASAAAVKELRRTAHLPSACILRYLDLALRSTCGAAVAVAQLAVDTGQLSFAGIGNVGARLRTAGAWQPLVSHPGIFGAYRPADVPVQQRPWHHDSLLVRHSDGLPSRWKPPDDTELLAHDPAVIAAAILRAASSAARPVRDDTAGAVLAPHPPDRRP